MAVAQVDRQVAEHRVVLTEKAKQHIQAVEAVTQDRNHIRVQVEVAEEPL